MTDLASRIGIVEVKQFAQTVSVAELYSLMHSSDPVVRRNAAWVMTHKSDNQIARLNQQELIDLVLSTNDTPLRRLTLNLVERQPMVEAEIRSDFLDYCLSHMTMLEEPPGVQSLCMKLAYRMCSYYPELMHEFQETLRLLHIEHYKPGLQCLVKKLRQ